MPDQLALVRMPDPAVAPGYRKSLEERSRFSVEDFGAGIVGIAPTEGPGANTSYFELIKLADAATDVGAPATWSVLRTHPPRQRDDVDADPYRDAMLARGLEIRERNPGVQSEIVAFALAAFGAAQAGDLDELLKVNLPQLFQQFPHGSLWQVVVSDILLARLAFGRTQLALQLTPDLPLGEEMDQLRSFSDLTLTKGIDFSAVLTPALVVLSPAVQGFLIPAMPHALVFCFGAEVDLRRPYPTSFSALYRPSVLNDAKGLDRSRFMANPQREDGPELLAWWVKRLDELYSHATDPTRFTDDQGYYDAAAQTAWMVTFERAIGDALTLLAEPQATDLDRVQMAFDLLDKAESLLGYGRNRSGKGFEALLRRTQCVPRLREAYRSLPPHLATRLGDEAERLFDDLYAKVRSNTLSYRLTDKGARIASGEAGTLGSVDNDALVSTMCRAIRNSSHGVLETLRDHDDRFLLAANTGGIPAELPALTPLIALSLFADVRSLVDGSWRKKLVGRP